MCKKHLHHVFFLCDNLCNSLSHINSTGTVPHQQGDRLLRHTCTETVAPGADGFCLESGWLGWNTSGVNDPALLAASDFPNKMSCCLVYLAWCSISAAISLYFLFFSSPSHSYHPSCPSLQSVSSPNLETPSCELDGDAGGMWSHPESQLHDSLDALATKFSLCDYSKHAARLVSLSALKTRNVSSSFCCHWVSFIERWAVLSIPLFSALCINYRKGIQNIS